MSLADERPNVILIVCDDLNDYVEGFGGHPQTKTPNMARLARSGVSFTQAHCNIPICGPSRASMFTGIYPHNSGCYGFTKWDGYEVLKNSRTIMDHFRAEGYQTLGTGKLMHHMVREEWKNYGNRADYGPFAFAGENKIAHPDVPAPYREIGAVDGSFGPFVNLSGRKTSDGKPFSWQNGGWGKQAKELRFYPEPKALASGQTANGVGSERPAASAVGSQALGRDLTPDELNGQWAVDQLKARADTPGRQPFFMGVGFIRPHTPLIVPQKFFDMFPLDSIELPVIRPGDVEDTYSHTVRGIPDGSDGPRSEDMGTRLFNTLVESYESQDDALRHFIQAYLASVASVDEQIGKILDAVDNSSLKDNTIIMLTSDHGWGMGEKNYLYKNSLWQESTRVPLIVWAPNVGKAAGISTQPVSLIDIYPTLIDLCGLTNETTKNGKGHSLDGHSLKPLLKDPASGEWPGPKSALTALYKWRMKYDPSRESYSLRARDWRYIRYENGKEELYSTKDDPHEWTNLAGDSAHAETLTAFREELKSRVPAPGSDVPPQPAFVPKQPAEKKVDSKLDGEAWKDQYFAKHPGAVQQSEVPGQGASVQSEVPALSWRAQWIWMPEGEESDMLLARKTFTLSAKPERATLSITASSQYELFVNGSYIGRGPEAATIFGVGLVRSEYPFERKGSLHLPGDPRLQSLWDAAAKTLQVCTTDAYTDNYRERRQYAQTAYYACLRNVALRFHPCHHLARRRGAIPTVSGLLEVDWEISSSEIKVTVQTPPHTVVELDLASVDSPPRSHISIDDAMPSQDQIKEGLLALPSNGCCVRINRKDLKK